MHCLLVDVDYDIDNHGGMSLARHETDSKSRFIIIIVFMKPTLHIVLQELVI